MNHSEEISALKKKIEDQNKTLALNERFEEAVLKLTHDMSCHPDWYDWPCDCFECRTCG